MASRRDIVIAALIGVGVIALAGFAATRPPVVLPPMQTAQEGGLTIETIDQMCKTLGATAADDVTACTQAEQSSGEFVIAWMGYNNFIVDGAISLDQIQLLASLDDNGPGAGLTDPALGFGFDSGADADPSLSGDASLSDPQITGGIDPVTGEPASILQSPAQLALLCLSQSMDWISMQECISQNDPSSHIESVQ